MHVCGFCKDPIAAYDKPRKAHLVIGKDNEGHVHTHGDLEKRELMSELLIAASQELGFVTDFVRGRSSAKDVPKEIVFHNRQRIGDVLMFTCGVRDFKRAFPNTRVNVVSTAGHIWDHNPYIDTSLEVTEENKLKIGPGTLTNASNRLDWHFANAYRVSIEEKLGVNIPQGESRPDIWLTEEEYNAPRPFKQPYWIIVVNGEKGWGCKMYPFERWQEVVDMNPDITFVQIGTKEDSPPRLTGSNVIDHVGKTQDRHTGIRDLFKLFLNAEGSIGLVSFHMHLSGALYKPSVVVAGAREPVSFTRYAGHQYLATDGTLPCAIQACWHCGIDKCTNLVVGKEKVPRCVDMIPPKEVSAALRRYYIGGRLEVGKPSQKPKLKNIVPTPKKTVADMPVSVPDVGQKYGFEWNYSSVSQEDWKLLSRLIDRFQVKTILEFGSGLSTLLMSEKAHVTSYETEDEWIQKVQQGAQKSGFKGRQMDIQKWDGKHVDEIMQKEFDLAFVDGPSGGDNREYSISVASKLAKIVVIDDGHRDYEREWQQKHLEGKLDGPLDVGGRCHLWTQKKANLFQNVQKLGKSCSRAAEWAQAKLPPLKVERTQGRKHFVKIVSTARGWGGCARSITTIMHMLVMAGHKVEFIPFRNRVGSREFKHKLENELKDVTVTENYESIKGSCDTLLVYADDFVWEFGNQHMQNVFAEINAERKIMMVNYRRGGIGEIPWTRNWDLYMFLNSTQEKDLISVHPGVKTQVLPPCTDLNPFLTVQPNYNTSLRIVRHNSQGDTKFPKNAADEIGAALTRPDLDIHMMPGPSFVPESDRFKKMPRNQPIVPVFLGRGNLFWYSLPEGYMDMGPRVILEAMAAGLPILADPWGGAVDRVTTDCGWLLDKKSQIDLIKKVTPEELAEKGRAAKARAKAEFVPERWLNVLVGQKEEVLQNA